MAVIARSRLPLVAGILVPIVCFVLDPVVFRASGVLFDPMLPLLAFIAVFAHMLLLLAVTAMTIELRWQPRSALLAGALLGTALFATILGLALVPISLIGIFEYGVGLLGFLPFLTAWSFWGRGIAAWRRSSGIGSAAWRAQLASVGIVLVLGIPAAAQWGVTGFVERAVADVLRGDDSSLFRLGRLRPVASIVDGGPFFVAYNDPGNAALRPRIEMAYDALTGENLERTLAIYGD